MLDYVIQIIVDMFHNSSNDINVTTWMFQRIFTSTSCRMYMMYYMNESNERVYTMAKVDPRGNPTFSAHPARLSSISMNLNTQFWFLFAELLQIFSRGQIQQTENHNQEEVRASSDPAVSA